MYSFHIRDDLEKVINIQETKSLTQHLLHEQTLLVIHVEPITRDS